MSSIAAEGYTFVPRCIDTEALHALRAEADFLFRLQRSHDALSEDEYFDKGCALDFFANNELREDDEARTSIDRYMLQRNASRRTRSKRKLFSSYIQTGTQMSTAREEDIERNGRTADDPQECWSRQHVSTIRNVIFQTVAGLANDALKKSHSSQEGRGVILVASTTDGKDRFDGTGTDSSSRPRSSTPSITRKPAREKDPAVVIDENQRHIAAEALQDPDDDRPAAPKDARAESQAQRGSVGSVREGAAAAVAACHGVSVGTVTDGIPLLFNEQYVVKPPDSTIEFGWHTDEREQLAMCAFPPGAHPPVYVSVWIALDDCDKVNGCLEVCPQSSSRARLAPPSDLDDSETVYLPATAGDGVVFLSNLWHRSGPNRTNKARRVFYSQYTLDVIRAMPSDPRPLSLAIPCEAGRRA